MKENPQWTLTFFRNSKSQQSAQVCKMHVTSVTGGPSVHLRAQGKAQVRAEARLTQGFKVRQLKGCSSRALQTLQFKQSHI